MKNTLNGYSTYTSYKEIYLQKIEKAEKQVNATFITGASNPQKDKLSATSLCNCFSNIGSVAIRCIENVKKYN